MLQSISNSLKQSASVVASMQSDPRLTSVTETVARAAIDALKNGNKLLFMGNGGSAADAQHLAGELVSRYAFERPGLCAFALTTDTSVMTAIGNDYGYVHLFARQVQAVGRSGDVLFGISTSGSSPNIISALEMGREMGLVTVGMTGNRRAKITEVVHHCIEIPCDSTPQIQEGHIIIGHIICGLIESQLFSRPE